MSREAMLGASLRLAGLLVLGCGGEGGPAHEAPAVAAGGEAEPASEEAASAEGPSSCADPDRGAFYLYVGAEAVVLTDPDGTRERAELDASELEEALAQTARERILARDPDAVVHVVSDTHATEDRVARALSALREAGLSSVDRCVPTASSPFPSAEEALFSEG